MKRLFFLLAIAYLPLQSVAQCPGGQLEFTMQIATDFWGYEGYWEIVPAGNGCGNGTIISGGNASEVGCFGGGMFNASGNVGYPSEAIIDVGPFCLSFGVNYQLIFVDDYGDGGFTFTLFEEGQVFFNVTGSGVGNTWTFTPGFSPIPSYALPCNAVEVTPNGSSVVLDNAFSFSTQDEITPDDWGCGLYGYWCESSADKTVWAKAIIPDNGSYKISLCNPETSFDTQLAVYVASDCSNYTTYDLISANDDMIEGCIYQGYASECFISCLEPGTEILIQIDGYYGESGTVELAIASNPFPAYADVFVWNSGCPPIKGEPLDAGIFPLIYGWGSNFDIVWSGPNGFTSQEPFLYFIEPGEYSFVATNACGESLEGLAFIESAAPFISFYQITPATCPQASNGSVVFSLLGGSPPYEVYWFGFDGQEYFGMNPTGMAPGTYELFAMDSNFCTFYDVVTVGAGTGVAVNLGAAQTICLNETVTLNGPSGMANYTWTTGASSSSVTLTGSVLGVGPHNIGLNVTDSFGCTGSGSVTITVENCIGVEEISAEMFQLYPNPANESIRISGPGLFNREYSVLDASGRVVSAGRFMSGDINVSQLESGMYFLRVLMGGGHVVLPFTKM
jgi:hypothetical protein